MQTYSGDCEVMICRIKSWLDDLFLDHTRIENVTENTGGLIHFDYRLSHTWTIGISVVTRRKRRGAFKYTMFSAILAKRDKNGKVVGANDLLSPKGITRRALAAVFAQALSRIVMMT